MIGSGLRASVWNHGERQDRLPGSKSLLWHYQRKRKWLWANHFPSLCLSFIICEMGIKSVSISILRGWTFVFIMANWLIEKMNRSLINILWTTLKNPPSSLLWDSIKVDIFKLRGGFYVQLELGCLRMNIAINRIGKRFQIHIAVTP